VAKSTKQNKIAKTKHQQTTHLQKKNFTKICKIYLQTKSKNLKKKKWQNLPNNKQRTQI